MVALSTLEAEFIACSNATREVVWLRSLLGAIISDDSLPQSPVYTDDQGALKLAESGVLQSRTKHIDVKFMHCHDEQQKGVLRFVYVPTDGNVADPMTEPLPAERHVKLTGLIGLWDDRRKTDVVEARVRTKGKEKCVD
jgi:hypothetical protein